MQTATATDTISLSVAAHFARFEPVIARIIAANPYHESQWQHSAGKAAKDIVQDGADDIRFGDDSAEVAALTARKLSAFKGA